VFVEKRYVVVATCFFLVSFAGMSRESIGGGPRNIPRDELQQGFSNPPKTARPLVWWHWMNGNITENGILKDLNWMHHVGIGGVQAFDAAAFKTAPRVASRLAYMTPAWQQALRTAVATSERLGLEFSIAGSPGWSESGGPWVKSDEAMKKVVWSETHIDGGARFQKRLPQPPSSIGPFQDLPIDRTEFASGTEPIIAPEPIYHEIVVLAYPESTVEREMKELKPVVTTSAGPVDGSPLWDGSFQHPLSVKIPSDGKATWIQVAFSSPQTIRAASIAAPAYIPNPWGWLGGSDDGQNFRKIIEIGPSPNAQQTLAFAPVSAKFFRISFFAPPPLHLGALDGFVDFPMRAEHRIAEFVLHTAPRVNHFEDKAGFFVAQILPKQPTLTSSHDLVARRNDIIDLTSKIAADGTLDWTPPPGRWTVLRIGYSLIGVTNHPASREGTGLEVDKLSRAHVESNYNQYLDGLERILGPELMGSHGLLGMVNDSWEAGAQNWTEDLPAEFAARRGYDILRWMPALTGRVIDSEKATDKFLWDFRKTLGELLAENHFLTIANILHSRGMIHYTEAHEVFRAFIGDGMDTKRYADVPTGAMWAGGDWGPTTGDADIRESASVAHLYGRKVVAAETFTASDHTYAYDPQMLKPIADRALAQGLNRFIIHTSVHQPLDEPGPGFTLGPFGQWFTRHETWAEEATPWITYLSRSSYLLQQGEFVADILYLYPEDSNITALYGSGLPAIPPGFNFDFVNADALDTLSLKSGDFVTVTGMHYRILAIDPRANAVSLPLLRKISKLVEAGGVVVGNKPQTTPSLADSEEEFNRLTLTLWGDGSFGPRTFGAGVVLSRVPLKEAVSRLKIAPDVSYPQLPDHTSIQFVHRRFTEGDIYFVRNPKSSPERIHASFRVSGKLPELWHADSGLIEPTSFSQNDGRTLIPLKLDPLESLFVVFRKNTLLRELKIPKLSQHQVASIIGPWIVHFQNDRGAPDQTTFDTLRSWTTDPDPRIKYFSGTATYDRVLDCKASWFKKGQRVEIDLGVVERLAEVIVNGHSAGILWKAPFKADLTPFLHAGRNQLTLRVTNLWPNRMIGDKQPGAKKIAWASYDPFKPSSSLLSSGLLGPVTLRTIKNSSVR